MAHPLDDAMAKTRAAEEARWADLARTVEAGWCPMCGEQYADGDDEECGNPECGASREPAALDEQEDAK